MKSFFLFLLFPFFTTMQSFANCYINTDHINHPDISDVRSTWDFFLQNPDCKITIVNLSDYWTSRNSLETIVFTYQYDGGHHGVTKASIGICQRDTKTDLITCKKEI